jgi:GT2 family glycosyltransferase
MSAESPVVTAVVLNWRDAASTARCVASLLAEDGVSRVVVVDNESTGELRGLAEDRVTLLEQRRNLGFSAGVNVGLRHALETDLSAALVINNDATVQPGAVSALIDAWRAYGDDAGLLAPLIVNSDGSTQSTGGHLRRADAATNDQAPEDRINYLTWACVLVPRSTLVRVGLLDEAFFMYWEDVDYGLRVLDHGLRLIHVPQAVVVHERSKSHSKAGSAVISNYSAHGLVVLGRKRRGWLLAVGVPYRLLLRVARRLASRDATAAGEVVRGALSGWRVALGPDEGGS